MCWTTGISSRSVVSPASEGREFSFFGAADIGILQVSLGFRTDYEKRFLFIDGFVSLHDVISIGVFFFFYGHIKVPIFVNCSKYSSLILSVRC